MRCFIVSATVFCNVSKDARSLARLKCGEQIVAER